MGPRAGRVQLLDPTEWRAELEITRMTEEERSGSMATNVRRHPGMSSAANSNASRRNAAGSAASEASGLIEGERDYRSFAAPVLRNLAVGEAAVCFAIILIASMMQYYPPTMQAAVLAACVGIPAGIAVAVAYAVASSFGSAGLRYFESGMCRSMTYGLSLFSGAATLVSFGSLLWHIHPFAAIVFGGASVLALVVWLVLYSAIVLEMIEKAETAGAAPGQKSPELLPLDGQELI